MKKAFIVVLTLFVAVTISGCTKQGEEVRDNVIMEQSQVASKVGDWTVYTNPQYQYELRIPKRWEYYPPDLSVDEVTFYPDDMILNDFYVGAVKVKGYVNWQNGYSIKEYYQNASDYNLWDSSLEREEIEINGTKAMWFKNNTALYEGKTVDFVVYDLGNYILEFQLIEEWETAKTILNSMYFYGNNTIVIE